MPQDFLAALTKEGFTYEHRSNNPKKDEITLGDGSRVRLTNLVLVKYEVGKKKERGSISYMICKPERIRK